ncbi:MAG: cellulase family glycosylhydrolase, partial [Thermoleophilia bacterium]|nr:cellulase family glycosylhydrolase [Thermoleophilia bacterium]
MRRFFLLLAAASTTFALTTTTAHATLYGFESNAELVNGNRTADQRTETITSMRQAGARVVRINVGWNEVAAGCAGQSVAALKNYGNSCYNWTAFDQVVAAARAKNMQVLASVSRAPQWLHGRTDTAFLGNSNAQWLRSVRHYEA